MTHAEIIAETLAAGGVERLFGLPGGEILAFVDACRRAGLRFFLTGHESSAAYMAQVTGQIGGVPGVCAATLGPGATNLVTGVANAFLDRAPLLAVTAQIPGALLPTMSHQRIALNELFAAVTKRSVTLGAGDTREVVLRGLKLASEPRPGPVHLALPGDAAMAEWTPAAEREQDFAPARGSGTELSRIAARIRSAERPLVLVGLGATVRMAPAVGALVDRLQAPFLVTPKAKGMISEDHPRFFGVASGMAIDREILETIRSADLIVGIGFDPVECDKPWFAEVEVVAVDSAAMTEGSYRPQEAIGDLSSLLAELTALLEPKPWPEELVRACRRRIERAPAAQGSALSPLRVIEELRTAFPRGGVVTCDVGSHKLLMGQFWRAYEPGTFFMSNGLSGMGFGVPAACAAQLAYPDRPVLAVVGDGGMIMTLHDLNFVREHSLPVIVVVFSDSSLSLIRVAQHRRGLARCGVDFPSPDFAALAGAFGIEGRRANTLPAVRDALDHALAAHTSLVLDVPVDIEEYYGLV